MTRALSVADVVEVPIDSIQIGERRRLKLGRVQALANSIKARGLIHPILIRGDRLVAGRRRLEACRTLGWSKVPARRVDRLSDDEVRAIELEENTEREGLTDFETTKQRLAQIRQAEADLKAKAAADESRSNSKRESKRNRGGQPRAGSKRAVAAETGISPTEQVRVERHVTLAEAYPFLQRFEKRDHVLAAGTLIEKLPAAERAPVAVLFDQPAIPSTNVIEYLKHIIDMTPVRRADLLTLARSEDDFDRRKARTMAASVPPPPDPGLLALTEAERKLRRAATECRSARFKPRVAALANGTAKLLTAFEADERRARNASTI